MDHEPNQSEGTEALFDLAEGLPTPNTDHMRASAEERDRAAKLDPPAEEPERSVHEDLGNVMPSHDTIMADARRIIANAVVNPAKAPLPGGPPTDGLPPSPAFLKARSVPRSFSRAEPTIADAREHLEERATDQGDEPPGSWTGPNSVNSVADAKAMAKRLKKPNDAA